MVWKWLQILWWPIKSRYWNWIINLCDNHNTILDIHSNGGLRSQARHRHISLVNGDGNGLKNTGDAHVNGANGGGLVSGQMLGLHKNGNSNNM